MSFGVLHVAPAITEFIGRYHDVQVDVSFDDRKVDVVKEGFDIAVRITANIDPGMGIPRAGRRASHRPRYRSAANE